MRVAAAIPNLLVVGFLVVFVMGGPVRADILEVEPDAFPEPTDLTNNFPGVTLSNQTMDPNQGVPIDVKPIIVRNNVNICSRVALPVAILSFGTFFDATDVDPTTVRFAGAGVKRFGKDEKPLTKTEDVNEDGLPDLVVLIVTEDLNLELGDTEGELTGSTVGGKAFVGRDEVEVAAISGPGHSQQLSARFSIPRAECRQ